MTPPRAYLFDLDGTLIDSAELIFASYRHTLVTHRGTAPPDEYWLAGFGTPLRVQLAPFARDDGHLECLVETYREFNLARHDALVRPFPGIRGALDGLREGGAALALVTSKARAGAQRGLRVCGLDDLFRTIVAADDVEKHKPDPTPVVTALEHLDTRPHQAVFVGDSPHDMAAGRAAGVRTAAALWGPFPRDALEPLDPDHWLTCPRDIESLGRG